MIKTMAFLFFVLSIINSPLYYLYSKNTENNDYSSQSMLFFYFSLGNMGSFNKICSNSHVKHNDAETVYKIRNPSKSLENADPTIFKTLLQDKS